MHRVFKTGPVGLALEHEAPWSWWELHVLLPQPTNPMTSVDRTTKTECPHLVGWDRKRPNLIMDPTETVVQTSTNHVVLQLHLELRPPGCARCTRASHFLWSHPNCSSILLAPRTGPLGQRRHIINAESQTQPLEGPLGRPSRWVRPNWRPLNPSILQKCKILRAPTRRQRRGQIIGGSGTTG